VNSIGLRGTISGSKWVLHGPAKSMQISKEDLLLALKKDLEKRTGNRP